MLPQKSKKWLPQKCWRTLLRGGLLLHFGKMAYFIAYGFINAIQTLEFWVGCLMGCGVLNTVDISTTSFVQQCEALFRQALWNYFDVFLAATGMTDIIMRVSWRR